LAPLSPNTTHAIPTNLFYRKLTRIISCLTNSIRKY
jgi:hypothetical protein